MQHQEKQKLQTSRDWQIWQEEKTKT